MIKKLRTRFILLSAISFFVLIFLVVLGMNLINYFSTVSEIDSVLNFLSDNKGRFPELESGKPSGLPGGMSPELPYESRYFSVYVESESGNTQVDLSRIAAVSEETALEYAENAADSGKKNGFVNNYRFSVRVEREGTRITFIDSGRKIDALVGFALSSAVMGAAGYILILIAIVFCSAKIIKPVKESYSKQKQFITDAGHELKTPLTVINAHLDLLEMEKGEDDSTREIRRQSARLKSLTNSLIYLAKMEEGSNKSAAVSVDFSQLVSEAVNSFSVPFEISGKRLRKECVDNVHITGNADALFRLASILLDNALKYSSPESETVLSLRNDHNTVILTVTNETAVSISSEEASLLFERFFRQDNSRNSATGGHGIGLSIAKAIVEAHNGKIRAEAKDNKFTLTAELPA